ncbi:hypothetical protein IMG5_187320 [Ichthyophthirius multifiliis]|uniref:Uncharacterized protein n=1 Tax=Ichthyophthirius multifiliis TaxID=5932 RepID=G0R3S1_ICHMU|nr:hypothetical protein IMG5_187320 [Ichthyophthirius multifiliis]EGR27888.1 hypothetical protein IMG5_187320 [Ichthyophthirius multifiliis]|eukprot:XP_004027233.1 hypothetical protein IMG5_187320 [Ichthyophthirius multifiliis]
MKSLILLLILSLAFTNAIVNQTLLNSLVQLQSKSADALDTASSVLKDLKQANVDAQEAADQLDKEQQAECAVNIAAQTEIVTQNKQVLDDAISHRKFIEQEIQDTNDYLDFINNRRNTINKRREELESQRCASNAFFVKSLKEHDDAIKIIELLKQDLAPYTSNNGQGEQVTELAQLSSVTDKLRQYSHLFNEQAIEEFNQLSRESVESSTAEWDPRADDNNKGELQLEKGEVGTQERDLKAKLGDKLVDLLDKLQEHLRQSIKNLTENEIRSAWDLAVWLQLSEQELKQLDEEEQRKNTYLEKLVISLQSAKAHEDKSIETHSASVALLSNIVGDCENKHNNYLKNTNRRNDENIIIDEVIQIFSEKVANMGSELRERIEDNLDNGQIDNQWKREISEHVERDSGRLHDNIKQETAF